MVLDASALLAFLFQEEGSQAVAAALEGSCMSAVNLSEVLGLFARDGKDTHVVAGWLRQLPVEIVKTKEPKGCLCGQILQGKVIPPECKHFGKTCTPGNPVGSCMVSSEGTCAAYFKYNIQS